MARRAARRGVATASSGSGPAPLAPRPERRLAPQEPSALATALRLLAVEPPQVSLAHMALRFPPVSQFLERFRSLLRRRRTFDFDAGGRLAAARRPGGRVPRAARADARPGRSRIQQAAPFAPIRIARADVEERSPAWNVRSA